MKKSRLFFSFHIYIVSELIPKKTKLWNLLLGLSSLFGTPDTDQETVEKDTKTVSAQKSLDTGGEGGGDDGDD